jgi:hypothetical protein
MICLRNHPHTHARVHAQELLASSASVTDPSQAVSTPSASPRGDAATEYGRRRGGSAALFLLSQRCAWVGASVRVRVRVRVSLA